MDRGSLAARIRVANATPIGAFAAHARDLGASHPTACHVERLLCRSTCPSALCFWLASSELGVIELVPESNPVTLRRMNEPHALLLGQGRCACVCFSNCLIHGLILKPWFHLRPSHPRGFSHFAPAFYTLPYVLVPPSHPL